MGGAGQSLVQNALSAGSDEDALSGAFSASLGRQSSAPWALPNPPGPQARGQKPALESTGSTQTALWHRRDLKGSPFCLPPGPSPLCLRPHPLCFLLGPELASDATTAPSRTTEDWSLLSNGCLSTLVSPVPRLWSALLSASCFLAFSARHPWDPILSTRPRVHPPSDLGFPVSASCPYGFKHRWPGFCLLFSARCIS